MNQWSSQCGRAQLYCGDCLAVMPTLPADSVDAIVTDPPYGLSFMGKDWDRGVPGEHFWREAVRVAKPGARLLAFGGTRTFHRLTCAIEDAGWEIRDCVMWVYSQGFPKSKNVGCKCGGNPIPYSHEKPTKQEAERGVRSVRESGVSQAVNASEERGEVLFESVQKCGASTNGTEGSNAEHEGREKPCLGGGRIYRTREGLSDDSYAGPPEGKEERLRSRTHTGSGEKTGSSSFAGGGGSPREQKPVRQQAGESDGIPGSQVTLGQESLGGHAICEKCKGLKDWVGFGSCLKPSWEPVIVARKPCEGTVAANVVKYGTGGINVDGCRIPAPKDDPANGAVFTSRPSIVRPGTAGFVTSNTDGLRLPPVDFSTKGRWPANLIHDGGDEVVRLFPDDGDASASRFFYCAKADGEDREHGNTHATVKPNDLMRYLCKLIAPKDALILDPFMGSGSTGVAAIQMHNRFIGIELGADHFEICKRRVAAAFDTYPLLNGDHA